MLREINDLIEDYWPGAYRTASQDGDSPSPQEALLASVAISAKRQADALEEIAAALGHIATAAINK